MSERRRLQRGERWLAWVRLGAVPFAFFQTVVASPYPPGHEAWAWATTIVLTVGAVTSLSCSPGSISACSR